jgi:general stress protein CsbA
MTLFSKSGLIFIAIFYVVASAALLYFESYWFAGIAAVYGLADLTFCTLRYRAVRQQESDYEHECTCEECN